MVSKERVGMGDRGDMDSKELMTNKEGPSGTTVCLRLHRIPVGHTTNPAGPPLVQAIKG